MGRTARSPDNGHRAALTFPHDPPRNGVLNSVSWQKIRKTAANAYLGQVDADWFHESDLSRSEVIRLLVSLGLKAKQK
jgi:hypothetical protein